MVLQVARRDAVLELTLNRPDSLNAFTVELHELLADALTQARSPDVRAVLITGAGRGFCAGQDLAEARSSRARPGDRLRDHYNPNLRALRSLDKPVVVAVNGVAAGAGVALALACDLRIVSRRASFLPAFIAIGLVPDSGLSWTAARLLGKAHAFEWLVSNRRLDADAALAAGLVSEVVEPDHLLERARRRCAELAELPGTAVGMTKRLLHAAATNPFDDHLDLERELQHAVGEQPAYQQRIAAFLDRRAVPSADADGANPPGAVR